MKNEEMSLPYNPNTLRVYRTKNLHDVREVRRFGLLPFRSPLLRECFLVFLPLGTEMFHFPRYALISTYQFYGFTVEGFPIRTSPDHRLLRTSPKLIATTLRHSSLFGV